MSSPIYDHDRDRPEQTYEMPEPRSGSSDEEHTFVGDGSIHNEHADIDDQYEHHEYHDQNDHLHPIVSNTGQSRADSHRLDDDLEVLRAEQDAIRADEDLERSRSLNRSKSRNSQVDEFDVNTVPVHEIAAVYHPPANPTTNFAKMCIKIHNSNIIFRYLTYILPVAIAILIPLLLGSLLFHNAYIGGVKMDWFCVWLLIVWLTLWAGRIVAKCLPYPIGMVASLFTNSAKKWRDMGRQLEIPATLFLWWLGIMISFLPIMKHHQRPKVGITAQTWQKVVNKIIISIFVGTVLNLIEKVIIQLIAISFHLRTYADRIELNKFQIGSLVKLYAFSKEKIAMDDSEFEEKAKGSGLTSGARTPMAMLNQAQKNTKDALNRIGDVAGKVAGDFTGKTLNKSTHPHQVVLTLLGNTKGSQVLARRLYRTFAKEDCEVVSAEDLKFAFDNEDEAEAAFTMFDKDLNGDISMEELEAVCVEIGRERKSITASLKDLDSVIGKLDDVLFFVVLLITVLVLISLISTAASGVLTSLGSSVLALSWLFSGTAQEFLASVIFVFVKHPFDVGDRVSVYGNTGASGRGDDYFVKEIALLYTEFKKMEGHIVQAPNSYLNTLFILNQRRSGGLAEAVPVTIKFGTTLDQIEELRNRLVEFVALEKREFQRNILTELREVYECHSITLNVIFFYKSNWQNEGLRLMRRNKFICALMVSMQECGIEGPRMRWPGQREGHPIYLQNVMAPPLAPAGAAAGGPDGPQSPTADDNQSLHSHPSILRRGPSSSRARGESASAMSKRVDFSLGMKSMAAADAMSDVHEDTPRVRIPEYYRSSPSRSRMSHEQTIPEEGVARTTSRTSSNKARASMDSLIRNRSNQSTHRNRFFGHSRERAQGAQPDLEQGVGEPSRVDPRSGVVSPQAVHESEAPGPQHSWVQPPRRAQTENFEMKRM
ncbi:hypothetical protein L228DRAFT_267765 [Xylona heveae TC161]|uniref:EF-hand domain-containing protein n=1 Tax=Xylona heveae (strain CBS 132557 / TC161) TaxID=1328760 RepID=A0A165HPG6_XYLHT|nr:hypothetical protein L228DRAFT_267765 [Xylona heveae TC161]KZF23801.1 hypothetical protein L228DRAFT_267765 [Xylona heveae TC161]